MVKNKTKIIEASDDKVSNLCFYCKGDLVFVKFETTLNYKNQGSSQVIKDGMSCLGCYVLYSVPLEYYDRIKFNIYKPVTGWKIRKPKLVYVDDKGNEFDYRLNAISAMRRFPILSLPLGFVFAIFGDSIFLLSTWIVCGLFGTSYYSMPNPLKTRLISLTITVITTFFVFNIFFDIFDVPWVLRIMPFSIFLVVGGIASILKLPTGKLNLVMK